MRVAAILVAAGRSERFGQDKLWLPFRSGPLWASSYSVLSRCPGVEGVGLVVAAGREAEFSALAAGALFVVPGGASRQESVARGLAAVPEGFDAVLIHDAARPFLTPDVVDRVLAGVRRSGAAYPAVPVTDTVRQVGSNGVATLDRSTLLAVQTPQGARLELLREAHELATGESTDDIALIEAIGHPAEAVEGDPANVKVTDPADLSRILGAVETRTGLGYDIHAFSADPDRPMWLGGVEFDDRPGLDGHSDADALLHAVVDALLGAAGLGDIGVHFPNSDERWRGRESGHFVREAGRMVGEAGWEIVHVDASVMAERPRVMGRRHEICERIAGLLGIDPSRVSVKATTNEGLGAIGRGEGVACLAVATLARRMEK